MTDSVGLTRRGERCFRRDHARRPRRTIPCRGGRLHGPAGATDPQHPLRDGRVADRRARRCELFDAQLASRHLDLAARWLRSFGEGYYTIGSAGHEGNAAVAAAAARRPIRPCCTTVRARSTWSAPPRRADDRGRAAIRDVLRGLVASAREPIAGGRHKVFGHPDLAVIPTTSTIASHLPRAVGLGVRDRPGPGTRRRRPRHGRRRPGGGAWPADAIVVCSFGDASVNQAAATAAFNTAGWYAHSGQPMPVLFVCEDNGLGVSVKSPDGWVADVLRSRPGLRYFSRRRLRPGRRVRGRGAGGRLGTRAPRAPAVLHLSRGAADGPRRGRRGGRRTAAPAEIAADVERDPLARTAPTAGRCRLSWTPARCSPATTRSAGRSGRSPRR